MWYEVCLLVPPSTSDLKARGEDWRGGEEEGRGKREETRVSKVVVEEKVTGKN